MKIYLQNCSLFAESSTILILQTAERLWFAQFQSVNPAIKQQCTKYHTDVLSKSLLPVFCSRSCFHGTTLSNDINSHHSTEVLYRCISQKRGHAEDLAAPCPISAQCWRQTACSTMTEPFQPHFHSSATTRPKTVNTVWIGMIPPTVPI